MRNNLEFPGIAEGSLCLADTVRMRNCVLLRTAYSNLRTHDNAFRSFFPYSPLSAPLVCTRVSVPFERFRQPRQLRINLPDKTFDGSSRWGRVSAFVPANRRLRTTSRDVLQLLFNLSCPAAGAPPIVWDIPLSRVGTIIVSMERPLRRHVRYECLVQPAFRDKEEIAQVLLMQHVFDLPRAVRCGAVPPRKTQKQKMRLVSQAVRQSAMNVVGA